MAPRKSTKLDAATETGTPEAATKTKAAKPRTRKAEAVPEPAQQSPATQPAAPKAAARKPKARKETPAPEPAIAAEAAPVPEPAPIPKAAPVPKAAPAAVPVAASGLVTEQAQKVLQAIHDGVAVELLFLDAETNPPRTFEPRQLIFDTFAKGWYVWGWDRRYNAERHHRLDLIEQVGPVEGMGRAAQGPYKEGTPANLIGGWLGGEPIHVKAVLLKQWIFAVRQAPAPFPEFKIEEMEEGKAQVTFTGTDLRAISRWAMQFGDGIQVIEPQRLQDRIKQVGIAWGGKAAAERPAAPQPQAARPPRPEHGHKQEHRSERPERPERPEHRVEAREPAPERRPNRPEPRHSQEAPKPAAKPGKIEIRFDRL